MLLNGIDVSAWQRTIDWNTVKGSGKCDFAIIRAGAHESIDKFFKQNVRGCAQNDIPYGLYWASYATNAAEARDEAHILWRYAYMCKPEYPLYCDFEEFSIDYFRTKLHRLPSKAEVSTIVDAFCNEIEECGGYVAVYANPSFRSTYLDSSISIRYDSWLAHWDIPYNSKFRMHQYSSRGRIDGVSGNVDLDYCSYDYPTLIRSRGFNGWRSNG